MVLLGTISFLVAMTSGSLRNKRRTPARHISKSQFQRFWFREIAGPLLRSEGHPHASQRRCPTHFIGSTDRPGRRSQPVLAQGCRLGRREQVVSYLGYTGQNQCGRHGLHGVHTKWTPLTEQTFGLPQQCRCANPSKPVCRSTSRRELSLSRLFRKQARHPA
jgi:hypothetical protein